MEIRHNSPYIPVRILTPTTAKLEETSKLSNTSEKEKEATEM